MRHAVFQPAVLLALASGLHPLTRDPDRGEPLGPRFRSARKSEDNSTPGARIAGEDFSGDATAELAIDALGRPVTWLASSKLVDAAAQRAALLEQEYRASARERAKERGTAQHDQHDQHAGQDAQTHAQSLAQKDAQGLAQSLAQKDAHGHAAADASVQEAEDAEGQEAWHRSPKMIGKLCAGLGALCMCIMSALNKAIGPDSKACKPCWNLIKDVAGESEEESSNEEMQPFNCLISILNLEGASQSKSDKFLVYALTQHLDKEGKRPSEKTLAKAARTTEGIGWLENVEVYCEPEHELMFVVYRSKALGGKDVFGQASLDLEDDVVGPMNEPTWTCASIASHAVIGEKNSKVAQLFVGFWRDPGPKSSVREIFDDVEDLAFLRALDQALSRLVKENKDKKKPYPLTKLSVLARLLTGNLDLGIGEGKNLRHFEVLRKRKSQKWFWVWYKGAENDKSAGAREVAGQMPFAAIVNVQKPQQNRQALALSYQGRDRGKKEEMFLGRNPHDFVRGRDEIVKALRLIVPAVKADEADNADTRTTEADNADTRTTEADNADTRTTKSANESPAPNDSCSDSD